MGMSPSLRLQDPCTLTALGHRDLQRRGAPATSTWSCLTPSKPVRCGCSLRRSSRASRQPLLGQATPRRGRRRKVARPTVRACVGASHHDLRASPCRVVLPRSACECGAADTSAVVGVPKTACPHRQRVVLPSHDPVFLTLEWQSAVVCVCVSMYGNRCTRCGG